ncbi:MAG: hypothetical protein ACE5F1_11020 [Planctomycetota bacterium]
MAKKRKRESESEDGVATIKVFTVDPPEDAYLQRHLDIQMSYSQALACRRLFEGLRRTGATLESGQHINRPVDVVRWLLEQVPATS